MSSFSQRHDYAKDPEISIREDIPRKFREPFIQIAARRVGSESLLKIVEGILDAYGVNPLPSLMLGRFAIGRYDDALAKVRRRIEACEWFRVYDIIEAVYRYLRRQDNGSGVPVEGAPHAPAFEKDVNRYCVYAGIGWQLVNGQVLARGDEGFQKVVEDAASQLTETERPTAANHMKSAVKALSERPQANTAGAVAHATSAVECLLHDITGEAMTLGKYLDKHSGLFHPALKKALDGVYGFASDAGARHGREGSEPSLAEAQFAVTTCAAACTMLAAVNPQGQL